MRAAKGHVCVCVCVSLYDKLSPCAAHLHVIPSPKPGGKSPLFHATDHAGQGFIFMARRRALQWFHTNNPH